MLSPDSPDSPSEKSNVRVRIETETTPKASSQKCPSHKPGRPSAAAGLPSTTTQYLLFIFLCAIPLAYIILASNKRLLFPY